MVAFFVICDIVELLEIYSIMIKFIENSDERERKNGI